MDVQSYLFSWLDYTLFIVMLVLSALIGVYSGFFQNQSTAKEYLLGGKQMSLWPVAMSLVSSTVSGLTLLSLPSDIYRFGITYLLGVPLSALMFYVTYKVYLPVFYKLQITSTYEYLNLRFDNKIRVLASALFTIYNILYLPIIIYVPALALSQVTGIHIHLITPLVCGVCIFYTTVGGIKAVVWTDALQFVIMMGSVCIVFVLGVVSVGGVGVIWDMAYQTGRLNIDFDVDMTKRDTFWTGTLGTFPMWLMAVGISQGAVQKCLSLPSFSTIRSALIFFFFGLFVMVSLSAFSGLVIFAKYFHCDPISSKEIKFPDQLLPFYVMDVAKIVPGLPGLFVSGIFSASLSTLSASMNCLAATIYEDFLSRFMPKNMPEERVCKILKGLVVVIGVLCTVLVFIVEHLGSLLPLAFSFSGITSGALLGLFTVGMLVPMVNSKGALWGGVFSLVIMTWIVMTAQWYKSTGRITYPSLPVSTDGCNGTANSTFSPVIQNVTYTPSMDDEPFVLYKISFYYYVLIGVIIVFVVSIAVSYFTEDEEEPLNRDCISPIAQSLIRKNNVENSEFNTIENVAKLNVIKNNE